eukprot:40682-Eustigmatos_ZCMA.PRE.1
MSTPAETLPGSFCSADVGLALPLPPLLLSLLKLIVVDDDAGEASLTSLTGPGVLTSKRHTHSHGLCHMSSATASPTRISAS